jgi:hypothetical protein
MLVERQISFHQNAEESPEDFVVPYRLHSLLRPFSRK